MDKHPFLTAQWDSSGLGFQETIQQMEPCCTRTMDKRLTCRSSQPFQQVPSTAEPPEYRNSLCALSRMWYTPFHPLYVFVETVWVKLNKHCLSALNESMKDGDTYLIVVYFSQNNYTLCLSLFLLGSLKKKNTFKNNLGSKRSHKGTKNP